MPLKGYKHTPEAIEKIRQANYRRVYAKGRIPWNKGKSGIYSEETLKKMSENRKGKAVGKDHHMYGKHHTEEAKAKIRKARKRQPSPNKGKTFSAGYRKKLSEAHKGQIPWHKGTKGLIKPWCTGLTAADHPSIKKIADMKRGVPRSPETKRKLRIAEIKRRERSLAEGGQIHPFYNPKGCEWFDQFDEMNNTHGQHAMNGGEHYIKELGYWVDYINHELRIIIEWDESYHYKGDGLKKKDKDRQREIEEHFPGYRFLRIRESKHIDHSKFMLELVK